MYPNIMSRSKMDELSSENISNDAVSPLESEPTNEQTWVITKILTSWVRNILYFWDIVAWQLNSHWRCKSLSNTVRNFSARLLIRFLRYEDHIGDEIEDQAATFHEKMNALIKKWSKLKSDKNVREYFCWPEIQKDPVFYSFIFYYQVYWYQKQKQWYKARKCFFFKYSSNKHLLMIDFSESCCNWMIDCCIFYNKIQKK